MQYYAVMVKWQAENRNQGVSTHDWSQHGRYWLNGTLEQESGVTMIGLSTGASTSGGSHTSRSSGSSPAKHVCMQSEGSRK